MNIPKEYLKINFEYVIKVRIILLKVLRMIIEIFIAYQVYLECGIYTFILSLLFFFHLEGQIYLNKKILDLINLFFGMRRNSIEEDIDVEKDKEERVKKIKFFF